MDLVHEPQRTGRTAGRLQRRRRCTVSASSPTWRPRLPADRSVKPAHTPSSTCSRHQNIAGPSLDLLLQEIGNVQVVGPAGGQVRLDDGRKINVESGIGRQS